MAYAGSCERHGRYVDYCSECDRESWLHALVNRIKSGVAPDDALIQILDEKLRHETEVKADLQQAELRKQLKALGR